jgi:hypothetical protein
MIAERGLAIDHSTIARWVLYYSLILNRLWLQSDPGSATADIPDGQSDESDHMPKTLFHLLLFKHEAPAPSLAEMPKTVFLRARAQKNIASSSGVLCLRCPVLAAWRATAPSLLDPLVFDLCHPGWRPPSTLRASSRETFQAQDRFSQLFTFQTHLRQNLANIHLFPELTTPADWFLEARVCSVFTQWTVIAVLGSWLVTCGMCMRGAGQLEE